MCKLQDVNCPVVILRIISLRQGLSLYLELSGSQRSPGNGHLHPLQFRAVGHSLPSTSLRLQGVHKQSHLAFYECTRDSELCSLYLGNKCSYPVSYLPSPPVLFGEGPAMQPWGTRYSLCRPWVPQWCFCPSLPLQCRDYRHLSPHLTFSSFIVVVLRQGLFT